MRNNRSGRGSRLRRKRTHDTLILDDVKRSGNAVIFAFVSLAIGFGATLLGQVGLSYLMKRYQRNSYIAFSIGAVVLLSAFLMTIQSLLSMAEGEHHHSGGICGAGD